MVKYQSLDPKNMKKYICILVGAALLAACEQKTETAAPAASPAAPAEATAAASPAESTAASPSTTP